MLTWIRKNLFWDRERFPDSYAGELNYQCHYVILPASIIGVFAWVGYITTDAVLFPNQPVIVYLRWGLSIISFSIFIVQFIPVCKKNSMALLVVMGFYLEIATGVLTGLTGGDPVYMAGYFYVLMVIIIAPINRWILWSMTVASVSTFFIIGLLNGMSFATQKQKYTLTDMVSLVLFSMTFTYVLDRMRFRNWQKSSELRGSRVVIERERDQISAIMDKARSLMEHVRETTGYLNSFSGEINSSIEDQSPVFKRTLASSARVIDSFSTINVNTEKQVDVHKKGIILVNRLKQEFNETMTSSDSVQKDAATTGTLADKCNTKLDSASVTITALKDESSRIAEISKTINDIADMTALLALNASIESARAGEHGRGFAVVADEISKLADDSMRSAKEISDIIRMSVARIAEASDQINETSVLLKEIITIMSENRSFLVKLKEMIQTLGNNLQELVGYFDISVEYTAMISTLTEKNGEEIRTYQAMIRKIETFYADLDSMANRLAEVSQGVNNEISQLEDVLKSSGRN